jgi:hypothetical protein
MRGACAALVALLFVSRAFAESAGDVRDVRVVRSADQEAWAAALGQPSIAPWRETRLVVAHQRNSAGKTDMGSIDAVVSGNDGDSWSIPSTIFDHEQRHGAMQFGYCNAVLYKPPGQEVVWCFAMRCPLNYADSEVSPGRRATRPTASIRSSCGAFP